MLSSFKLQVLLRLRPDWKILLPAAFNMTYSHLHSRESERISSSKFLLSPSHFNVTNVRFRTIRKDKPVDWLPFPWDWPPTYSVFDNSGDLVKTNEVDPTLPKPDFELSDELKNADENVKKVFSAATTTVRERSEISKREILKKVQRHPLDHNSPEVKIALMTIRVRKLFELRALLRKDYVPLKVTLLIAIQRRNKLLKDLYRVDIQRFNWLTKVLQIEYNPHPMGVVKERFSKKWDLRRLTREYCISLKNQKRAAYLEELKAQQEEFLREKERTLAWIAKEEKELGIQHSD